MDGRHMRAGNPTRKFMLAIFATAIIAGATAAGPDPPETAGQGGQAVVVAEPCVVDLGRVSTCSTFHWTLRLINNGPETKRVQRIGTPGECGIWTLPGTGGDYLIPPHSPLEVEIARRVGVAPGPIRERVIALIEDHPPVEVLFRAEAVSFIQVVPERINPAEMPDGRVTVRAIDGQPFRILRVLPPFIEPPPEGASAEHTIVLDWDCWREADRPSSFALETDHSLCPWTLGRIRPGAPNPPMSWDETDTEWDAPVFGVPKAFDLGPVPTSTKRTLTMYLINAGDEQRRLLSDRGKCDCWSYPDGKDLAPGQVIRATRSLSSGINPGKSDRSLRLDVDYQQAIRFRVRANIISYVTIEPLEIDFYEDPEPCIRVYSVDGQPFRIRSVFPLIYDELPQEAAVEHFIYLDWQRWCESRHQRRMLITTDHPLCPHAYARLKCGPS